MAELVEIIGITHNPFLPNMLKSDDPDPVLQEIAADYALMRERLAQARPDVLVVIASDHLNQWFMDNMPAFLVGKAPQTEGPFPHEQRNFGIAPYRAMIDTALAKWFVAEGFGEGVDFAFSDEFTIDHAFTVPLNFVRPEMDLPIVPIWTNVMAPPLPPAERFYTVGQALGRLIARAPSKQRIAVVTSGHLAVEVGGPKPHTSGSTDEGFDRNMMAFIGAGDVKSVLRDSTFERLLQAGNVTPGFLNYVMLMGVAEGRKPSAIALRFPRGTTAVYYMEWGPGKNAP
jgi:protocatechuate 4,5-dioxygenase, beta chain